MRRLALLPVLLAALAVAAPLRAAEPAGGLPRRAFLGARLAAPADSDRVRLGLSPGDPAVLLQGMLPGSSLEHAGVTPGDAIVALDGAPVREPAEIVQAVAKRKAGARMTLGVRHGERTVTREVRLAPYPVERGEGYDVTLGEVTCRAGRLRTIWTRPRTPGRHPALMILQGIGTFSIEAPLLGMDVYGSIVRDFTRRGFVTLRVDKPGCGDSEGGPLRDRDFDSQLDGFRAALAALRADPAVDPGRILLFGHSMGGAWAPLLAAEMPVRGIAVYGTLCRTWTEYVLENTRRQEALGGRSAAAVDSMLKIEAAAWQVLDEEGLTPREMARRHPALAAWVDSSMTDGTYYSGCHYTFFRQLAAKNLAAAWQACTANVLALHGGSDFLSAEEDHALIARIVNQAHPGQGRFEALEGVDHAFRSEPTQAASYATWGSPGGSVDPRVLEALRAWSGPLVATAP